MTELVIAHIVKENPDGLTGTHTHIRELRRYLDQCGIASIVITPFSWGRALKYPVFGFRRVIMRFSKGAGTLCYQRSHIAFLRQALRRYLAEHDDCVIYAQSPLEASAALRARKGPHQRIVMAVHFGVSNADEPANTGEVKRDGRIFRMIRQHNRDTILNVDGMVCVSEWARNAILSWLPEAADVPHAIVSNFIHTMPVDPNRTPVRDLVTTGRLNPEKNQRFLIEVLGQAKKAGHRLTLDLIGDGPCRGDLERLASSLGVGDQVRFLGFRREIRGLLPDYRVYVHSSKQETSSLSIMEAMAAGLPIVAGKVGALPELFDEGVEGRFWPVDDPARAAAILTGLLDSEPDRKKAALAAMDRFHRDFATEAAAPRLKSLLFGN